MKLPDRELITTERPDGEVITCRKRGVRWGKGMGTLWVIPWAVSLGDSLGDPLEGSPVDRLLWDLWGIPLGIPSVYHLWDDIAIPMV